MILAIKKKAKTRILLKLVFVLSIVFTFIFLIYKNEENKRETARILKIEEEKRIALEQEKIRKEKEKLDIQRIILIEAEKVVALIGQEFVSDLKIVKNKIVYVLKPNTNIDAISIRYGAMALVKKSFDEIVVVVDMEYIVKARLKL